LAARISPCSNVQLDLLYPCPLFPPQFVISYNLSFQIEKLKTQADEQEATLVAQEEEVHGKQRELDELKVEEKELMTNIKKTQREILHLEEDLKIVEELEEEVRVARSPDVPCSVLMTKNLFVDCGEARDAARGREAHDGGHEAV
jgi:hypothetical protein